MLKSKAEIETMLKASPVLVYTFYRLLRTNRFELKDRLIEQKVNSILTDIVYCKEYVDYLAPNMSESHRREKRSSAEVPGINVTTEGPNGSFEITTSKTICGHLMISCVTLLLIRNPPGVYSRSGDLVKYYITLNARYYGATSENQSLAMRHTAY